MADNRCVCCGDIIPEGMMACPDCLGATKKMRAAQDEAAWSVCPSCGEDKCVGRYNCKQIEGYIRNRRAEDV
jgi:NMD protein affecting ribosome stability and mRNA decay